MGQSISSETISYKPDSHNWREISPNNQVLQQKVNQYCRRTLFNSQTKQYVEEYQIYFLSESDFNEYSREFNMRKERKIANVNQYQSEISIYRSPYIYRIKEFINHSTIDICSSYHKGLLYVDKVDLRLKEITDIPFEDHVCLTFVALQGFKLLYQKVGYFDITEEMIFITYAGQVKVWINPNLSKHEPFLIQKSQQFQELHGSQSYMIINLLTIIQKNTDTLTHDLPTFKRYLINKGTYDRLSFYKALEELEIYCLEYKLNPCTFMKSIYDIYNDEPNKLEQSNVIRFQTFRDLNRQLGFDKSQRSSREKCRKYSPQVKLKEISLRQSHASKKSYYSHQSSKKLNSGKPISIINHTNNKKQSSRHNSQKKNNYPIYQMAEQPKLNHQNIIHYDHISNNHVSPTRQPKHQVELIQPIKLDQLEMRPIISSNRMTSIRNSAFPKHQEKAPELHPHKERHSKHQPNQVQQKNYLKTINTMNSMSTFSARQTQIFENKSKQLSTRINFYSPNLVYSLDNEIMEDLEKMLGFNPNNF